MEPDPTQGDSAAAENASPPPAVYERTDAVLVRQPIVDGEADTVRELVASARPEDATDASWLVDAADVATVTLFLAAGEAEPALVWYVEVTTDRWTDREAELIEQSPLVDAGLPDLVADTDDPAVDASEQAVHVRNPARPGTPDDPDVVLVRLGVRPGAPSRIARGLVAGVNVLEGTRIHRRLVGASGEILEDERMWTETLWLERTGDDYAVRWYMEADDMAYVTEAYEASDNPVARWSDVILGRVFEQPVQTLGDPMAASDFEVLAHATNPDRR